MYIRKIKRANGISTLPGVPQSNNIKGPPDWWVKTLSIQKNNNECLICGDKLKSPNKLYCSDKCRLTSNHYTKYKNVSTIRRTLHYWFDFMCQDCGKELIYFTRIGYVIPAFIGEVHHIVPLGWGHGGKDHFDNLTLLCSDCHKKAHDILKTEREARYREERYER